MNPKSTSPIDIWKKGHKKAVGAAKDLIQEDIDGGKKAGKENEEENANSSTGGTAARSLIQEDIDDYEKKKQNGGGAASGGSEGKSTPPKPSGTDSTATPPVEGAKPDPDTPAVTPPTPTPTPAPTGDDDGQPHPSTTTPAQARDNAFQIIKDDLLANKGRVEMDLQQRGFLRSGDKPSQFGQQQQQGAQQPFMHNGRILPNTTALYPGAAKPLPMMDNRVEKILTQPDNAAFLGNYYKVRKEQLDRDHQKRLQELDVKYPLTATGASGVHGEAKRNPQYQKEKAALERQRQQTAARLESAVATIADIKILNDAHKKATPVERATGDFVNLKKFGRKKREILGDETLEKEKRYEMKGIPVSPKDAFMNDFIGLQTARNAVMHTVSEYQKQVGDEAAVPPHAAKELLNQLDLLDKKQERLYNDHPQFVKEQLSKAITEQVVKNKGSLKVGTGAYTISQSDINKAAKELGVDLDAKKFGVKPGDMKTANIFGTFINELAMRPAANIGGLIMRSGRKLFGQDSDWADYHVGESKNKFTNLFAEQSEGAQNLFNRSRVNLDKSSGDYLLEVPDKKINWNVAAILNTIGSGFGQLSTYGIGAGAAGGLLKATGAIKNADKARDAGLIGYAFLTQYDDNYESAKKDLGIENEAAAHAFSFVRSLASAYTEKIFPDYKVTDALFGAKSLATKQLLNYISKVGVKEMTGAGLKPILKRALKEGVSVGKAVGKGALDTSKEVGEEWADVVAERLTVAMFQPKALEGRPGLMEELGEVGLTTAIGTIIPVTAGHLRQYKGGQNTSPLMKKMVYDAGQNPEKYISAIQDMVDQKQLTQAEADEKYRTISHLKKAVSNVPDILNDNEKADYVHSVMEEKLLQDKFDKLQEDGGDAVEQPRIDEQIKKLQNRRSDLLSNARLRDENGIGEDLFDFDQAEKDIEQLRADWKEKLATTEDLSEEDKEVIDEHYSALIAQKQYEISEQQKFQNNGKKQQQGDQTQQPGSEGQEPSNLSEGAGNKEQQSGQQGQEVLNNDEGEVDGNDALPSRFRKNAAPSGSAVGTGEQVETDEQLAARKQKREAEKLHTKANELHQKGNSLPPEQMEEKKRLWAEAKKLRMDEVAMTGEKSIFLEAADNEAALERYNKRVKALQTEMENKGLNPVNQGGTTEQQQPSESVGDKMRQRAIDRENENISLLEKMRQETGKENFNEAFDVLGDRVVELGKSKPGTKEREQYLELIDFIDKINRSYGFAINDKNSGAEDTPIQHHIDEAKKDIEKAKTKKVSQPKPQEDDDSIKEDEAPVSRQMQKLPETFRDLDPDMQGGAFVDSLQKGDTFKLGRDKKYEVLSRTDKQIRIKLTRTANDGKETSETFGIKNMGGQNYGNQKVEQFFRDVEGEITVDLINENNKLHEPSTVYKKALERFNQAKADEQKEAALASLSDDEKEIIALVEKHGAVPDWMKPALASDPKTFLKEMRDQVLGQTADGKAASDGKVPGAVQKMYGKQAVEKLLAGEKPADSKEQDDAKEPVIKVFPAPDRKIVAEPNSDFLSPEEAARIVQSWKDEARRIGQEEDRSNQVIISMFDFTGAWSQPFVDAGYTVIQLDIQHGGVSNAVEDEELEDMPDGVYSINQYEDIEEAIARGEKLIKVGGDLLRDPMNPALAIRDAVIAAGKKVSGVLSATPCTTYAGSGAQHWPKHDAIDDTEVERRYGKWASKHFESPRDYNDFLVGTTEIWMSELNPDFNVMENPVGRIAEVNGLPEPTLQFHPNAYGDNYTKRTQLWGKFNPNLPQAPVEATDGSKIQSKLSSKQKVERSTTPSGFAYAFFIANTKNNLNGVRPVPAEKKTVTALHDVAEAFSKRFGVKTKVISRAEAETMLGGDTKSFFFKIIEGIDVFDSRDPKEAKDFIERAFRAVENKDEAKKVYRTLAIKYHPDKQGSTEIMQILNDTHDKYQAGKLNQTSSSSGQTSQQRQNSQKAEQGYDEWYKEFMRRQQAYNQQYSQQRQQNQQQNQQGRYNAGDFNQRRYDFSDFDFGYGSQQRTYQERTYTGGQQQQQQQQQKKEEPKKEVKKGKSIWKQIFDLFSSPDKDLTAQQKIDKGEADKRAASQKRDQSKRDASARKDAAKSALQRQREQKEKGKSYEERQRISDWYYDKSKDLDDRYWNEVQNIDDVYNREWEKADRLYKKGLDEKYKFQLLEAGQVPAGFYDESTGTAYIVEGVADETTPIHEIFSHPFIIALEKNNPELYDNLFQEAYKSKEVTDYIDQHYFKPGVSQRTLKHETIARAIDLEAKGKLQNKRLIDYIREFWKEATTAFQKMFGNGPATVANLSPKTTVQEIVDFVLNGSALDLSGQQQQEYTFHTPNGKKLKGQAIEIPGFEKVDFVTATELVKGMEKYHVYELATGREIPVDAFTPEAALVRAQARLAETKVTQELLLEKIDADTYKTKFSQGGVVHQFYARNHSPRFEAYKAIKDAQRQAEKDTKPFVYEGQLRTDLQELLEQAKNEGLKRTANLLQGRLEERMLTGNEVKVWTVERVHAEMAEERELNAREADRTAMRPYPAERIVKKGDSYEDYKAEVNGIAKDGKDRVAQVEQYDKVLADRAFAAWQKEVAIRNKYGYFPPHLIKKELMFAVYQVAAKQNARKGDEAKREENLKAVAEELQEVIYETEAAYDREFGQPEQKSGGFFKEVKMMPDIDKDNRQAAIDKKNAALKAFQEAMMKKRGAQDKSSDSLLDAFVASESDEEMARTHAATAVLKALYPEAELRVLVSDADFMEATGLFEPSRGYVKYGAKGKHTIFLNRQRIADEGSYKTFFHEVIHPVVLDAFGVERQNLIPLWNRLSQELEGVPGMEKVNDHINRYTYDGSFAIATEGLTELLTQIVEGNIAIDSVPKQKGSRIVALLNRLFELLGMNFRINQGDFRDFAEALRNAFASGDISGVKPFLSDRITPYLAGAYDKGMMGDPEVIARGVQLMTAYADMGIFKFGEIVRDVAENLGKDFLDKENVDALKGVYSYYRSNLSKQERQQLSNEDEVDEFIETELPQLLAEEGFDRQAALDDTKGMLDVMAKAYGGDNLYTAITNFRRELLQIGWGEKREELMAEYPRLKKAFSDFVNSNNNTVKGETEKIIIPFYENRLKTSNDGRNSTGQLRPNTEAISSGESQRILPANAEGSDTAGVPGRQGDGLSEGSEGLRGTGTEPQSSGGTGVANTNVGAGATGENVEQIKQSDPQAFEKLVFSLTPRTNELEAVKRAQPKHVLLSYAHWKNKDLQKDFIDRVGYRPETVMVDSGAYTFAGEGKDVGIMDLLEIYGEDSTPAQVASEILYDLYREDRFYEDADGKEKERKFSIIYNYVQWLITNRDNYDIAVNMDEMGDAESSMFAYQVLNETGSINPMPVFHFGSSETYLEEYIESGATLIGLGASAGVPENDRAEWARPIIEKYPNIKFHLLGTMNQRLIDKLPGLYSADGTAWIRAGRTRAMNGEDRTEATADEIKQREQAAYQNTGSSQDNAERIEAMGGEPGEVPKPKTGQATIVPDRNGRNFVVPPNFDHGKTFNVGKRLDANIKAIETLLTLLREERDATQEEKETLFQYVGWGGIKEVRFDPKRDGYWVSESASKLRNGIARFYELAEELKEFGIDNAVEDAKSSASNAHYTSIPVIRGIYEAVESMGFPGGKVLEPSMGSGNFFGAMPYHIAKKSELYGVEKDGITGQIARKLYPDAAVKVMGLEKSNQIPGYMDLLISNIPFGSDIQVYDPVFDKSNNDVLIKSQKAIHNYFFAKAIESVREGGIIAFVTSTGVLDSKGNQFLREHIAKNAEFLGAIRLPDHAFKGNAGTEVVTDIVFLRKFLQGETSSQKHTNFLESVTLTKPHYDKNKGIDVTFTINKYFADNPQMVIGEIKGGGMYAADSGYTVEFDQSRNLQTEIAERAKLLFPQKIYKKAVHKTTDAEEVKRIAIENVGRNRPGNIIVEKGQAYKLEQHNEAVPWKPSGFTFKRIVDYTKLRDALNNVIAGEISGKSDEVIKPMRDYLNEMYDNYVKKYKFLNTTDNQKLLSHDIDGYNVGALERFDRETKKWVKADIFTQRTISPYKSVDKADNIQDALLATLGETGSVDIERMAELMGKTVDEVAEEGKGIIFEEPSGGFVTADAYLSGNVRKKLEEAKMAAEINPKFQNNVDALQQVIPEDIRAVDIEVRVGARWVGAQAYEQFAREVLGGRDFRVTYNPKTDEFKTDWRYESTEMKDTFGTARIDGAKLFDLALQLKEPVIRDRIDADTVVINVQETAAAVEKQNAIKDAFRDWLWKDDQRRETLGRIYNDTFNNTVKRTYDGSFLTFPGMQFSRDFKELRQHQKDAIWMMLQNNGGIIDHIVGAGKTLVMVAAAMEMKRMGIAKKPMIIAMKANVHEIAAQFKKAYPQGKILAPKESDFSAQKRKSILAQIANNDWDAIVITHQNFHYIPQSVQYTGMAIRDELEQLDETMRKLEESQGRAASKQQMQGLQKKKDNLIARLQKLSDHKKDEEMREFQELGVDHLMVDESQIFKNLTYSSSIDEVAGMGSKEGSERAFNLLAGVRYLQDVHRADKGITFLSGTPISNTIVEMYLLLKYLRPRKLEELGMKTFDAWVTTFASYSTDVEFAVTGALGTKKRFREFLNVPELAMLYNEIADVRNDTNLKLPKPEFKKTVSLTFEEDNPPAELPEPGAIYRIGDGEMKVHMAKRISAQSVDVQGTWVKRPPEDSTPERMVIQKISGTGPATLPIEGYSLGNYILKVIPQSDRQKEYSKMLIEFAKSKGVANRAALGMPPLNERNKKSYMVNATTASSKMAIDLRLLNKSEGDTPGGKLDVLADTVLEHFNDSQKVLGTQLIFSDIGTPKAKAVVPNMYQILLEEYFVPQDDLDKVFGAEPEEGERKWPSITDVRKRMENALAYSPQRIDEIVEAAGNAPGQFTVYDEVRRKLMARGIPEDQIAFIHDYKTKKRREELFKKVNDGEIRIVLGSTGMLGTGVNVQQRIVAMHHLDVPWKPADMEQRNGRGVRQGNWVAKDHYNNEVPVYAYATELTLDAYKYQLLAIKQAYIDQIKSGAVKERTFDEGDADGEGNMGLSMMLAAVSGNPDSMTLEKVKRQVKNLETQRKNFEQEKYDAGRKINALLSTEKTLQEVNGKLVRDLQVLQQNQKQDEKGDKIYRVTLDGNTYDKAKEAGEAFIKLRDEFIKEVYSKVPDSKKQQGAAFWDQRRKELGTVNGHPIVLTTNGNVQYSKVLIGTEQPFEFKGLLTSTEGAAAGTQLNSLEKRITDLLEKNERELTENRNRQANLATKKDGAFPKEEEYQKAKQRQNTLQQRLNAAATASGQPGAVGEVAPPAPSEQRSSELPVFTEQERFFVQGLLSEAFPKVRSEFHPTVASFMAAAEKAGVSLTANAFVDTEGTIHYNPEKIHADTQLHEHGHLLTQWAKKYAPALYDQMIKHGNGSERIKAELKAAGYTLTGTRLAEEAFVTMLGRQGAWTIDLTRMEERKANAIWEFLDNVWTRFQRFMIEKMGFDVYRMRSIKYMPLKDFLNMLNDKYLLSGVPIGGGNGNAYGNTFASAQIDVADYNLDATQIKTADKIINRIAKGGDVVQELRTVEDAFQKARATLTDPVDIQELEDAHREFKRYVFDALIDQKVEKILGKMDLGLNEQNWKDKFQEKVRDRMQRLVQVQGAAEMHGVAITEENDALNWADRWKSIAAAKVDDVLKKVGLSMTDVFMWQGREKIEGSLFDRMAKDGMDINQFGLYLYALHAPERNAQNARDRRNAFDIKRAELEADYQDVLSEISAYAGGPVPSSLKGKQTKLEKELTLMDEYEALYTKPNKDDLDEKHLKVLEASLDKEIRLMDDGGSGMTDQQAMEIVIEVQSDPNFQKYEDYRVEVREAIIDEILEKQLEYGMINQETYDKLSTHYQHYVPLKVDPSFFGDGSTFSESKIPGAKIWRSKGADYIKYMERVNPFTQALIDVQAVIFKGEENHYRQVVGNLAKEAQDFKVWRVQSARYMPIKGKNGRILGMKELPAPQNSISFLENGVKKYVVIHDKALLSAIDESNVSRAIPILSKINQFFRLVNTVYNPEFTISNALRDTQAAGIYLTSTQKEGAAGHFTANFFKVFSIIRGVWRDQSGKEQGKWTELAKEYRDMGGEMTWFKQEATKDMIEDIEGYYKKYQKSGLAEDGKQLALALAQATNKFNTAVENATRLNVYASLKEAGVDPYKAAEIARNATINFQRKGTAGPVVDSLYLFYNASVQGTANVLKTLFTTKTGRFIAGGIVGLGVLQSILNNLMSDCGETDKPSECYDNVKDYEKDKNIIIKNPFGAGFIKIPMAYGYNFFWNLGENMGQLLQGKITAGEATVNAFKTALNAFNPIGSSDTPLLQQISPTATDPLVQYFTNRDAFGRPIYSDNQFDKRPDSQKGNSFDSKTAREMADWLNRNSGGNEKVKGKVDVTPGMLDWFMESFGGGLGRFGGRVFGVATDVMDGGGVDATEWKDMPFMNRFYSKPKKVYDKATVYETLEESYNTYLSPEKVKAFKEEVAKMKKDGAMDEEKAKRYVHTVEFNQFKIHNKDLFDILQESKKGKDVLTSKEIRYFEREMTKRATKAGISQKTMHTWINEVKRNQRYGEYKDWDKKQKEKAKKKKEEDD